MVEGKLALMDGSKTLVLYGGTSANVRKVGIMLEELGVPYELRYVDVFAGDQFKPEFLAMNPLGKIPVLVDPALGRPLFESGAILFYLAERHGRFFPGDGPDRYEIMQWLMVQMALIGPMFGQLAHFRGMLRSGTEPYAEARYAEQTRRIFQILEERLRVRAWIAADAYSIADMAVYPWAVHLEKYRFSAEDFPALFRWRDTIAARPAVIRANARWDAEVVEKATQGRRTATDQDLDRFFGRAESVPKADFSDLRKWSVEERR
jgi:GSH-dependent disulfide-bond oxidoreductase